MQLQDTTSIRSSSKSDSRINLVTPAELRAAFADIERYTPKQYNSILRVLTNLRTRARNSDKVEKDLRQRIFVITAIVLYSRYKKSSNQFAYIIGNYLSLSGLKNRSLDILARQGFTNAYTIINSNIHLYTEIQKVPQPSPYYPYIYSRLSLIGAS